MNETTLNVTLRAQRNGKAVVDERGFPFAVCRSHEEAVLVANAVNAHPDLIVACNAAKAFLEGLRVPQDIAQAAEQVRQGMHLMRSLNEALAKATGAA